MRKIVAVLLVLCMMIPTCALADNITDLALSAKRIIDLCKYSGADEYSYTNVLGSVIVALSQENANLSEDYYTMYDDYYFNGGDYDKALAKKWIEIKEKHNERLCEIIQDAEKCYKENKYNFDVLQKYVDYLLYQR